MPAASKRGPQLIMREGLPQDKWIGAAPLPPPDYHARRESGLYIERNVPVTLRDGVKIFIDVYRPDGRADARDLPAILAWSPYGKHNVSDRLRFPGSGVQDGWMSRYTAFEAPDPLYWCRNGYAVVNADPRGMWYSQGEVRHNGRGEGEDCYDLIEWLAPQPWCNGKVGMSGVSYLAAIQYLVATLKPPHLAAINPWEAFSDWYREFAYHGGIPETGFLPIAASRLRATLTRTEDTLANAQAHPLWDEFWESKALDLASIEVPAFVVASWSDQGLHTRGTLECFKQMRSPQKWLLVHGQKKWAHYYTPQNVARLREFFDHFLRGAGAAPQWPKVQVEVRESAYRGSMRNEAEWPLARTRYTPLYLNAADGTMDLHAPVNAAQVRYAPRDPSQQAVFEHVFDRDTELTGHMKLRLWVEADGSDDMDLFVGLQKFDAGGSYVPFIFYACFDNGPVALGWLRVSHRELDEKKSTPWQPIQSHVREQRLQPGEIVPVDIEIWPSSTKFARGERLRVVVKGGDIYTEAPPGLPFARHEDTRNEGTHIIHTGGRYDSHLLAPVIPSSAS
jgi:uncharacterized protein